MLAESEFHSFLRVYRYIKRQQTAFSNKYKLASGANLTYRGDRKKIGVSQQKVKETKSEKSPQKVPKRDENPQPPPAKKIEESSSQKVDQDSDYESVSEEEIVQKKIKTDFKQERRKVEMTLEEYNQLKKYNKINNKHVKIVANPKIQQEFDHPPKEQKRKKKYKRADETKQSKKYGDEGRRGRKNREEKRKEEKILVEYDDYLNLDQIEKSRTDDEGKYFKGRVEFGQGPKWRGRIVSDELQGVLLIEGKYRNRVLHDDKVYFQVIHKEKEKTNCNIVQILPSKREIVGRIDYISSKCLYIMNPINSRIAVLNAKSDSISKEMKKKMNSHYFRAQYLGWEKKNQYPECKIIEEFGKFGDIEIETSALLRTHNVEDFEHDPEIVQKDLAKFLSRMNEKGQYEIQPKEIAKRQDLRKERIFTIDPLNARDFDDALSITQQEDGYEIGVHIADASFFCEQGSMVDREARKRTTSVYLVHRVIPMLPRLLCENFCSLNPGCERLTFSLWVKLSKRGEIMSIPRISRSIIKSCARFTYEQAQDIIDGKVSSQKDLEEGFGCVDSGDFEAVAKDIKNMHKLAAELRRKRVQRGSLFFEIPRKVFQLNEEKYPKQFKIYERKEAHFLVEEFMIMANELIGDILVKQTGEKALLRRHRFPGQKKIERFQQFMKNVGVPLKLTSTTRVQDAINEVLVKGDLRQCIKDLVKYEMIGLLQTADYFLVGKSAPSTWIHYALNSAVYTHFTSPIRRYPDILVHRQLAAILDKKIQNARIPKELIDQCNQKKLMAKRVSNGCEKIFMCLYLKENHVITRGIVTETEDWGIKICITTHDFKGILRFREIEGLTVTEVTQDEEGKKILKMDYKAKISTKFSLRQYQELDLRLDCKDSFPVDYRLSIILPHPKRAGQHLTIG